MGKQTVEYRRRIRIKALQALGGKCARCGFDDWRALQIDHINGGGTRERRNRKQGTISYYLEIIKNPDKNKYQILCANCNWIKRYEEREDYRRDQSTEPVQVRPREQEKGGTDEG